MFKKVFIIFALFSAFYLQAQDNLQQYKNGWALSSGTNVSIVAGYFFGKNNQYFVNVAIIPYHQIRHQYGLNNLNGWDVGYGLSTVYFTPITPKTFLNKFFLRNSLAWRARFGRSADSGAKIKFGYGILWGIGFEYRINSNTYIGVWSPGVEYIQTKYRDQNGRQFKNEREWNIFSKSAAYITWKI